MDQAGHNIPYHILRPGMYIYLKPLRTTPAVKTARRTPNLPSPAERVSPRRLRPVYFTSAWGISPVFFGTNSKIKHGLRRRPGGPRLLFCLHLRGLRHQQRLNPTNSTFTRFSQPMTQDMHERVRRHVSEAPAMSHRHYCISPTTARTTRPRLRLNKTLSALFITLVTASSTLRPRSDPSSIPIVLALTPRYGSPPSLGVNVISTIAGVARSVSGESLDPFPRNVNETWTLFSRNAAVIGMPPESGISHELRGNYESQITARHKPGYISPLAHFGVYTTITHHAIGCLDPLSHCPNPLRPTPFLTDQAEIHFGKAHYEQSAFAIAITSASIILDRERATHAQAMSQAFISCRNANAAKNKPFRTWIGHRPSLL